VVSDLLYHGRKAVSQAEALEMLKCLCLCNQT
jgi:hypothetical protein